MFFTILLALASMSSPAESAPPNIVLFLIDDLGWRDVGFMGSTFYETPRIDSFAKEGMVFGQAYANAPNCAPTRACLMTGLYTPRHGVYTVGTSARGKAKHRRLIPIENRTVLPDAFVTLPECLKAKDYVSASIGKWHLGEDPLSQGFDLNVGGDKAGHPKSYFSPYKNKNLSDGEEGEYLTDRLTDEAIAFIKQNDKGPFFLYLTHFAVHTPIQAPQDLTDRFRKRKTPGAGKQNAKYAAMIAKLDHGIGRVLDVLSERGLDEKTLVLFLSDNGGHGGVTSNAPLRGAKGMLYEGGLRIPMIAKWKGRIRAGSRCDTPVITTDVMETLIALAGVEEDARPMGDGVDLAPLMFENGSLDRDEIHWHFPAYLQGGKGSEAIWRTTPAAAIRVGDYKLLEFFEDSRFELYNLSEDPSETENLAVREPERVSDMHRRMLEWRERVGAKVPTELNPAFESS